MVQRIIVELIVLLLTDAPRLFNGYPMIVHYSIGWINSIKVRLEFSKRDWTANWCWQTKNTRCEWLQRVGSKRGWATRLVRFRSRGSGSGRSGPRVGSGIFGSGRKSTGRVGQPLTFIRWRQHDVTVKKSPVTHVGLVLQAINALSCLRYRLCNAVVSDTLHRCNATVERLRYKGLRKFLFWLVWEHRLDSDWDEVGTVGFILTRRTS